MNILEGYMWLTLALDVISAVPTIASHAKQLTSSLALATSLQDKLAVIAQFAENVASDLRGTVEDLKK